MAWSSFNHTVFSIPPSDDEGQDQATSQPDPPGMSEQALSSATQQNVQGDQISPFLLLEHSGLLKKFVELQKITAEQESQKQTDLLKDEVAQFEDLIPLLQYKTGETSYRPSTRLDRANQKAADLERANIKLSGQVYELQGSAKNEHYQCELLQRKVVELEAEKQKQESNVKSLEATIVDLTDNVRESQADAHSEHRKREALQKECAQLKSDKKAQLQKLESVVQLHESDIKSLTDENAALSKEITQARDRAKDAHGSVMNAQQVTSMAEDAYVDLQMQKDHDELSRKYGENDADSVAKRFAYLDTIIEDQAAQIHRLEIDLEEMDILQETNQELEEANRKLKDDGQQWKEASLRTAEDNQKLEEPNQALEEANQKLEDDHRTSKMNNQKLYQESQNLKAALEKGNQVTVTSGVDEATMQWVLRARHETLQLERDLDTLEAAWYGDEATLGHGGDVPTRPVSAPATSVVQEGMQERDSDSNSFEQSHQSSEIGEPQTMTETWARQLASYPLSAGLASWRNSESQPGTRPGSRLGYSSIYTPSQRSIPNSIIAFSKPLPSARLGLISRGTDAPTQRPNRHSLQSRRSSIALSRDTTSNAVPTLAELKPKTDAENFYSYFPHLPRGEVPFMQVPSPEAPKPPSAAQYHPGMESRDFAVEVAQSSQKSLAFYRHNGVQIMEEARAPVRPLHRGRKASLSTISERSGSIFSPRRSESRMRAWLTDDEIRIIRGTGLCERGTQTEAELSSASHSKADQQIQLQSSSSIVYDHGTQTELPTPIEPVLTYDQETQTVFDDATTALIDEHFPTVPPAHVYHSTSTQSRLENGLDPDLDLPLSQSPNTGMAYGENQLTLQHLPTQSEDPQTATKLPELIVEEAVVQGSASPPKADKATATTPKDTTSERKALLNIEPLPTADKGTAMTPTESTFEHKAVKTRNDITVSTNELSMQTDLVDIAELPASVPTSIGYRQVSTDRPVSAETVPRTPRSRVAAFAQLFEKDNSGRKGAGRNLAVVTSRTTQSPASKGPSETTTPTKLFTASPHLPFARNDAVTRSLRPASGAKHDQASEHQEVQPTATAIALKQENATSIETLPAKTYQESFDAAYHALPHTIDAGVQTSATMLQDHGIPISEPAQVIDLDPQNGTTFDPMDISPPSTVTWETPDDNPYPTPAFYTAPWRSPITPDYSGLEVVTKGSSDDSDKVLITTAEEASTTAYSVPPEVAETTAIPPDFFARTAMPSPGEMDSESDENDESDEDDSILVTPERRHSWDLMQAAALRDSSITDVQNPIDLPSSQDAIPGPVEAPAHEIITIAKKLTHRSRPSTSPVSPEDAWQLQVVKYTEPNSLPSPEPRFNDAHTEDDQERMALQVQRPYTERPVLRSLTLHNARTPRLLDSPMIPFPDFDDQLFESPSEYTHSPYLAQRMSEAPGLGEINTTNESQSPQLRQPPHRPPPLDLLRQGSVAEPVTPPIDSPYAPNSPQQDKKRFRFQALAALEGMTERLGSAVDYETAAQDRGSSSTSKPDSDRTFAGSSARPSPLRFGKSRFPQPEPLEFGVSEIGATSPTTPKSSRLAFFDKPASSIQQRRHKKAASLPATAAPFIAGLLEWHPPPLVDNTSSTPFAQAEIPKTQKEMPRQDARAPSTKDKSSNTPTFAGGFRTPPALDPQDLDHLPLPILPLLFAHLPKLLRDSKNIKLNITIDWAKFWWTVLWMAMATYFLFNLWLSILLRDHIDDWKSANVSSRKYNHITMARDEYWGNSWWKLIEFWMAGRLGGPKDLFV